MRSEPPPFDGEDRAGRPKCEFEFAFRAGNRTAGRQPTPNEMLRRRNGCCWALHSQAGMG